MLTNFDHDRQWFNTLILPSHESAAVTVDCILRLSGPVRLILRYTQGRNHVFKVGVQFLGLRNYYPSTEKLDRSTQFGAVGYIITLYSPKSYVKCWGVRPNFGEVQTPDPPVIAPMVIPRKTSTVEIGGTSETVE